MAVAESLERPAPFEIDLAAVDALPEPQRSEELARIALFKEKIDANPIWGYVPHAGKGRPGEGGQIEYHDCSRRGVPFVAAIAGNRWGKTHGGVVDNLIQILPPEFVPPWLEVYRRRPYSGDFRCRSVVVDIPNALTKVFLPKVKQLVPRDALWKGDWAKAYNDRNRMLTFADGSWWDFLTHDMDIDAFAGAELDRVHFDEEPPGTRGRLQYEESLVRLVDRDGDIRFTLTPLLGLQWVYEELTENDQLRHDDETYVVTGSMTDNPHLGEAMRKRLERRWKKDPTTYEARMHGRFVHLEGLVYTEFREEEHVVADRPIPRNVPEGTPEAEAFKVKPRVPIYASLDPGIDHPAAIVFFWVNEDDVVEVFYAEKESDLIVADVADKWHTVCRANGIKPRWTTIDPSARNRNPQTGRSTQQLLTDHKVTTIAGQNDRLAGYDVVKERLRSGRLVIHASCEQLIDEFRKYRWKQPRNTQVEDAGKPGAVIKKNDDLLDALRYGLMSMPVKAAPAKEEEDLDRGTRMFRDHLKRISRRGSGKRPRVGAC